MKPIVIIDDNPDDTFFLRRLLLQSGVLNPIITFQTGREATSGMDGLAQSADSSNIPQVVLCDLYMPGMRGTEVLHWVRSHPKLRDVRFIMVTGIEDEEAAKQCLASGPHTLLKKFPSSADLAAAVRG